MVKIDSKDLLRRFEDFLVSIPLERYRNELMPIKTVEQELPPSLNPLPAIYNKYWLPEPSRFPEYEDFFSGLVERESKSVGYLHPKILLGMFL